jgi:hypothetical protein
MTPDEKPLAQVFVVRMRHVEEPLVGGSELFTYIGEAELKPVAVVGRFVETNDRRRFSDPLISTRPNVDACERYFPQISSPCQSSAIALSPSAG